MSTLYLSDPNNVGFGVQASNVSEIAQFSSTTSDSFFRLFTNNGSTTDNLLTGSVIGSSNWDGQPDGLNQLYLGNLTAASNIQKVFVMQQDRVGINTTSPAAPLHVYGSNASGWNSLVRVEVNSNAIPAFPALVVSPSGAVGIGTEAISSNAATVKGTLQADYIQATNLTEIFMNIANRTYINNAVVDLSTVHLDGTLPISVYFNGTTNTTFNYTLTATSNSATYFTTSRSFNNTVYDSPDSFTSYTATPSYRFTNSGNYTMNISVATSGYGSGSTFTSNAIASFYVPPTDQVGAPTVSLIGTPTLSATYTYVSGIPYYANGTTVTFPTNSLAFTNMFNILDPRYYLGSTGSNAILLDTTTLYNDSNVFTNLTTFSASNNYALSVVMTETSTTAPRTIPATVYNINYEYPNGNTNSSLFGTIGYLGAAVPETSNLVAFSGMPIYNIIRQSISATTSSPDTPTISTDLSQFSTPTTYDSFYAPYTATLYASPSSVPRGVYNPPYTPITMSSSHLTFVIYPSISLNQFVINMPTSMSITGAYVNWSGINLWWDATILYTSPGGCASATYNPGSNRFPVQVNNSYLPYSTVTPIYVNLHFSGSGAVSSMSITST